MPEITMRMSTTYMMGVVIQPNILKTMEGWAFSGVMSNVFAVGLTEVLRLKLLRPGSMGKPGCRDFSLLARRRIVGRRVIGWRIVSCGRR
jgi:hypothetical protein